MLPPNLRSPPKLLVLALLAATLIILPTLYLLSDSLEQRFDHDRLWALGSVRPLPSQLETGGTIMGALTNETIKCGLNPLLLCADNCPRAEVGRASWKLLHTMAGRFPDRPTEEERETYRSFLHLFSRLYPCGDCATHFQQLLKDFPPQVRFVVRG